MILADSATLLICLLLMFLVVPVIGIEQVAEFPDFVLHMRCLYLGIVEVSILQLLAKMGKWMRDFIL